MSKSLKILSALVAFTLFLGFVSAEEPDIQVNNNQPVFLNDQTELDFTVTYAGECSEERSTQVTYEDDSPVELNPEEQDENIYHYEYDLTEKGTGNYYLEASCAGTEDDSETYEADSVQVEARELSINIAELPEEREIEYGEEFSGFIEVEDSTPEELSFGVSGDVSSIDVDNDGEFTVQARETGESESDDTAEFEVKATYDYGGSDSFTVRDSSSMVLDPYTVEYFNVYEQGERVSDPVKHRNMDDSSMEFRLLERGQGLEGVNTGDFSFDGRSGSDWFEREDLGDGEYVLEMQSRIRISGVESTTKKYPISVSIPGAETITLGEFEVERDVEFTGRVRDRSQSNINTYFEAVFGDRDETFSTDDGLFQRYFTDNTADYLNVNFPEAGFQLKNFNFAHEDPGNIRYHYYEDPREELDVQRDDVRPVNLATTIINYDFEEDSDPDDGTVGHMNYGTSELSDPTEVDVYECRHWDFDAENCVGEWERTDWQHTDPRDSGYRATFPVTPLSDESFSANENRLFSAYMVAVPEGVGESLTLEDSLDISERRFRSGEEFSVSGKFISDSSGEPVNDVEINLTLDSGEETIDYDATTGEEGKFEFSDSIEDPGEYSLELNAEKHPYESFTGVSENAFEVYYETGLTVSTPNDVNIRLGETSNIEFTIENTGQTEITDLSLEVSGVDSEFYSLEATPDTLASGATASAPLVLDLPEDYCPQPCTSPPTIELSVTGESAGEELSNRGSIYTSIEYEGSESNGTEETSGSSTTESSNDGESRFSDIDRDMEDISRATGDFIESQSDLNLALGLIFVFALVLAVAVKNKNGDTADRDRMRKGSDSGRVQRPSVSPADKSGNAANSQDTEEDEKSEEESQEDESETETEDESTEDSEQSKEDSDETDEDEKNEDNSEEGDFKCDTCGETFDTESGKKLHEQAMH